MRLLNNNQIKIIEETNEIYASIPVQNEKIKQILFLNINEITKMIVKNNE